MKKHNEVRRKRPLRLILIAVLMLAVLGPLAVAALAETLEVSLAKSLADEASVEAESAVPPTVSLTVELKVADQYLGGNGGVFHAHPVTQNSITANFRNGCSAGFWLSQGLEDNEFSSNFGDEFNPSGACAKTVGGVDYEVGLLYVDAHRLGHMPNGDVWDPYVAASRTFGSWTPSLRIESYIPGGPAIEGGWLIHGRLTWSRTTASGFGGSLTVGPTFDDGAFGFEPGVIGFAEVSVSVPLGPVTLAPSYKRSTPLLGAEDRDTNEAWAISTSLDFNFKK